jgi:hypothetical protein
MTVCPNHAESAHVRFKLVLALWLSRLIVIWLFVYPVFKVLANSRILQSNQADRMLFRAGGETLIELLAAREPSFVDLAPALALIAPVVAILGVAGSSFAWTATSESSLPLGSCRLRRRVCSILPGFAAITLMVVVLSALLVSACWMLLPSVGALLEPWVGERKTDWIELCLIFGLLLAVAALVTLADLLRASMAVRSTSLASPMPVALALFSAAPLRIIANAWGRFALALALQLLSILVLGHGGWLTSGIPRCLLALACSEITAFCTLWLRLSWIAWVCNAHRRLL